MTYKKYWVGLSSISCLGPKRILNIINHFGTAQKAWHASREQFVEVEGISQKIASQIEKERKNIDLSIKLKQLQDNDIKVITYEDENYPQVLKYIHYPPALLYVKGEFNFQDQKVVGIVGTRKYTSYGKRVATKIAGSLTRFGFTIVSGLARGIDTFAHRSTLDSGGRTVAVLGCGIDVIYPRQNINLAREIVKEGALISEFPPGTPPAAGNFPRRNRIISGLAYGLVVVEAAEKSGALITADYALEQGKDVFAVPGNIDSPYSRGCNKLIKEGAVMVGNPLDIVQEMGYDFTDESGLQYNFADYTDEEKRLLAVLDPQPMHIDEILKRNKLSSQKLNSLLTSLELKGAVRQLIGKYFQKA